MKPTDHAANPICRTTLYLLSLSVVASLFSCASKAKPEPAPQPQPVAHVAAPAPSAPSAAVPASGLVFTPASGWISEPTTGSMRKAQYRLPHAEGDPEDATLIVYFFGGSGGSREANLERWAGQFEQPGGGDSLEALEQSTRMVAGLQVLDVSISGTYVAETSPGSGERVHEENWSMLASIIENVDGPWYVKLVGPRASIAKWSASYTAFISSAQPKP